MIQIMQKTNMWLKAEVYDSKKQHWLSLNGLIDKLCLDSSFLLNLYNVFVLILYSEEKDEIDNLS